MARALCNLPFGEAGRREANVSKLLHDIRRAELFRREVERTRQMSGRDPRDQQPDDETSSEIVELATPPDCRFLRP